MNSKFGPLSRVSINSIETRERPITKFIELMKLSFQQITEQIWEKEKLKENGTMKHATKPLLPQHW